jgi:hypothetical protein
LTKNRRGLPRWIGGASPRTAKKRGSRFAALLGRALRGKSGGYPCFPPSITGNNRKIDSAMKYPG